MENVITFAEKTRTFRSAVGILLIYGSSIALSIGLGVLITHLALEWIRS